MPRREETVATFRNGIALIRSFGCDTSDRSLGA